MASTDDAAATAANTQRFNRGFAALYHTARPSLDITTLLRVVAAARGPRADARRPALVVDLGAGTGLSTVPWAAHADRVVGVEPSDDMRRVAAEHAAAANVTYVPGVAEATGLPAACADIVTVAQALHWMPPAATFTEAARVLRPGGIFVAYDADWPPLCGAAAEAAYAAFIARTEAAEAARGASLGVVKHAKDAHAARMRASGAFAHVRDIAVHQAAVGSADDLVSLALSQGSTQAALAAGATLEELGVEALRAAAAACLGDGDAAAAAPWLFTYRVRIGVV